MQREPAAARMVPARGVDEQDVGKRGESPCRTLEQRALTKGELPGGVIGRRLPADDGHVVTAGGGCERRSPAKPFPVAAWSKHTKTAPTA